MTAILSFPYPDANIQQHHEAGLTEIADEVAVTRSAYEFKSWLTAGSAPNILVIDYCWMDQFTTMLNRELSHRPDLKQIPVIVITNAPLDDVRDQFGEQAYIFGVIHNRNQYLVEEGENALQTMVGVIAEEDGKEAEAKNERPGLSGPSF